MFIHQHHATMQYFSVLHTFTKNFFNSTALSPEHFNYKFIKRKTEGET